MARYEEHTCEGLEEHSKLLVEVTGNQRDMQRVYKSHEVWRFGIEGQRDQWLIEYCPYCGTELKVEQMAKQEEIEKGIATLTGDYVSQILKEEWITVELTKLILKYLHPLVAIKVAKPLPPLISKDIYDKDEIDIAIKQAALMIESGYTATEPLIIVP